MLRSQGTGGIGNIDTSSIAGSINSSSLLSAVNDPIANGMATNTEISNAVQNSSSALEVAQQVRNNDLSNALAGKTPASVVVAADNAITSASANSLATQSIASQYLSDSSTGQLTGSIISTANQYTGGALNGVQSLLNTSPTAALSDIVGALSSSGSSNVSMATPVADRRIRLRPKTGITQFVNGSEVLKPLISTNGFMFPFTPTVQLSRKAKYSDHPTVHNIQDYKAYVGTSSVEVSIEGIFTAQNQEEALFMLACYHFMKACTLMVFGKDSTTNPVGTPPPVLLLSGYGGFVMNDLPVIIEDFDMEFPSDVDYVGVTVNGGVVNLPTKTTMHIKGTVQNTPAKLRQFDWGEYLSGALMSQKGWY